MKGPIRILNMFTIMNRGGAETMVMNYYRNIDRSKIQFDFLVHRSQRGAYDDEIEALGGKIYRMIPIYPKNFKAYQKMLEEFFKEHKEYKIIHSHMSELGYFAFAEAEKQGVKIRICHAHNAPHGWDIKMIMRNRFKKKMMPHITHMFTCGEEAANWLYGKEHRKEFIHMNNAIDAQKFRYNPQKAASVRKSLGLMPNQLVVGHVGRFNKQKNHTYLIEIFKEVVRLRSDAVLLLVGVGYLMERIKAQVEENKLTDHVRFLGSRDDVNDLMQIFDVFLFPSLFEGFPVTMVEAQAGGNLCMISKEQPKESAITPNVRRISLQESPRDWAKKIVKEVTQYQKTDTYEMICKAGYDIHENVKKLEEFYCKAYEE
ncbi:glycosyltransferase family 1 protein [Eubacterium oxidoreducens]|uniref:Glycosyltransferase involved in cell wall bisynthesis n=1 Tax=Eubacterium oxidoreducens TaxID=1732 RepID=A0A1G6BMN3_EUBOX|nr:glycosyltransferase family 1 protein [Eubacterium oxidoreducens]SDB21844.1 Glycosyltransferase involved in cell wall bisynthesis [Eubacterium oxidoreducens]